MSNLPASVIAVESANNERFRSLQLLLSSSRERRKRQRSVIEGVKAIRACQLPGSGGYGRVHEIFLTSEAMRSAVLAPILAAHTGTVVVMPPALLRKASQLANSNGPVAIVDTPRPALPERFDTDLVYLDRVQDPGNIGTIIRTCAAAGVSRVVTSPGTAFCWAPKVLRAAMGAHFSLQIYEAVPVNELLARLAPEMMRVAMVAPVLQAGPDAVNQSTVVQSIYEADLSAPLAWLFGNEGEGLVSQLLASPTRQLSIPQQVSVESLNVAAAVAVGLFEARRQRAAHGLFE